jgi:phytanoyl-CoA hydroxylase
MELSDTQVKAFEENGFVVVDSFFDTAELANFRDALRGVIRSALKKAGLVSSEYIDNEFGSAMSALEARDHRFISEIYDIVANLPEFLRLVAKPEYTTLTNQLLGRQKNAPLYSMTCRCRIDPPDDVVVLAEWHQEIFYSIPKSRFIQVWAPLIRGATVENGAMKVCVGSHKSGIVKQTWDKPEGRHRQMFIAPDLIAAHEQKSMVLRVGQIVLFSPYLIHSSGTNSSDEVRFTLIAAFHDIDNRDFQPPGMSYNYRFSPWDYYHSVLP